MLEDTFERLEILLFGAPEYRKLLGVLSLANSQEATQAEATPDLLEVWDLSDSSNA